jgi:hypothetical protein
MADLCHGQFAQLGVFCGKTAYSNRPLVFAAKVFDESLSR